MEGRTLKFTEETLSSAPDISQLTHISPVLLHTIHYNRSHTCITFSLCKNWCHMMHCKTCILSVYFATVSWRPFTVKVSFMDKLCFTRTEITNFHTEHAWPDENRHAIQSHHQQWQFFISLWAAILGDCHIGPHILLEQISGLNFLQTYLWPIGRYVLQYASLLWF
jgi:hypothetical protein